MSKMIVRTPGAIALAFAAISTTACGSYGWAGQSRSAPDVDWEGELAPGQTLEVKGVNGSIRAIAGSGADARVRATRTGRQSDPDEVEIVFVEHDDGVTVCAVYPSTIRGRNECLPGPAGRISAARNDVVVQFAIEVPRGVSLVARTANGSIDAEGMTGGVEARSSNGDLRLDGDGRVLARTTNGSISVRGAGDADVRTTNGRIRAELQHLDGNEPMALSTTNGSISLRIPDDANVNVDARTTNGGIETDLPVTVTGRVGRRQLTGTIGSGGRELRLRTTNGTIRIERGI